MTDSEKLEIYERNEKRLIKALSDKIHENRFLTMLNIHYCAFLTDEQIQAAKLMSEAMMEKV